MNALVAELKELDQDFEWYPTTQAMINIVKKDMIKYFNNSDYNHETKKADVTPSWVDVLDCGAGDGRICTQLANGGKKYAIEKSKKLIETMPDDVFIVGTDFFQSTLIDKEVDVIFCNPPYSEYIQWAQKIILEANSKMVYLILPQRWSGSNVIKKAIKSRKATYTKIGSDNFLDAERSARATVDIISVRMFDNSGYHHQTKRTDPFDIWFETHFKLEADKEEVSDYAKNETQAKTLKEKIAKQLTINKGIVPIMVELYNQEMDHLQNMFLSICKMDADILKELNVNLNGLREALKQRITGLKNKYWKELFNNYEKITKRLTHDSRKTMLAKLSANTSIDFTESNIYAVSVWVIKNANKYYDSQLIEVFERMINDANVILYKSNKRVWTNQDWRYNRVPEGLSHFSLELRIVLHNTGGVENSARWCSYDYPNNLRESAHNFLDDLSTIANNLGFELPSWENSKQQGEWESNKSHDFFINRGQKKMLMSVKAFKNGNMHIKFNQDFIRTLNVEFGRLKGWLTNHIQASEELNIPVKQTEQFFKANYRLTQTNGFLQIGLK